MISLRNGEFPDSIPEGRWASHIEQEDRKNLVMVEEGRMIGTSSFGRSRMAEMGGFGEIISLYLLPEYMGKGYGRCWWLPSANVRRWDLTKCFYGCWRRIRMRDIFMRSVGLCGRSVICSAILAGGN